jgi:thioredoxin reductase (NADPH)
MEEALTLTIFAAKVYVVHRRDSFRASKIMQQRVLKHPKIEVIWNAEVKEVVGQERVEGVRIKVGEEEKTLEAQGMFLAIGHKPNTDFLKDSGIMLDKKGYVKTTGWAAWEKQKDPGLSVSQFPNLQFQYTTNIDGVFAAGDCVDYVYRQAATAVGMGVAAALEVERYLAE